MQRIHAFVRDFWGSGDPTGIDETAARLWNSEVSPASYGNDADRYRNAILEQYKVYVEMADRISARRALSNTFFLTLNTAVLTAIGVFWDHQPDGSDWSLTIPLIVLLGQCLAWY
jgi:hypothetical protein